ncbi:MAG: NBR1-Ig-like domain-containing protein [Chloroflexi bacterium]|nr:NBR1-Ig-like domain-containing protein [Chloroflexota bacterium]
MQHKKFIWLALLVLLAASLVSCNIGKAPGPTQDVNAIVTSAAGTALAQIGDQMTQTAQALPPMPTDTPTSAPLSLPTLPLSPGATPFGVVGTQFVFNTPGAGALPTATKVPSGAGTGSTAVGCNDALFLVDATIPDGTVIAAGKSFDKAWQFQNTGTCTWDEGFSFVYVSGDRMSGNNIIFHKADDFVKPGHGTSFIVPMVAPTKAGTYIGYWQMKDDAGHFFGTKVYVKIVVQ